MKTKIISVGLVILLMGVAISGCMSGTEYDELKASAAEQETLIEEQADQIADLEAQIDKQEAEVAGLMDEIKDKDAQIAELKEEISETDKNEESEPGIENIEIKYDDGTGDGSWALGMQGKGYVVLFSPPVVPFTIDAIKIYGLLYGTGYEKLSAEIEVWNEDFDVLYNCQVPHTIFGLVLDWIVIETPGVVVDSDFYIFVYTNSPAEGGIQIYYDASVTNTHSEVTREREIAEWYLETPKDTVNWMIRVEQAPLPVAGGSETAKIEISFDPNPVPVHSERPRWEWKVILTEVNGIGVYLREITKEEYIHDNLYESKQWSESLIRDAFPPDAYLSASGSLDFKTAIDYGSVTRQFTHCIYIVVGIDDGGNEVRAEGKVDLVP